MKERAYSVNAVTAEEKGRAKPIAVVKIKIEEIYSLKPGTMAGEKIA